MRVWKIIRDETGSVLVEATIVLTILLVFVMGSIDFLLFFYDWNAATKAVQIGARIASVSNPVVTGLEFLPASLITRISPPGSSMPTFNIVCDGAEEKCTCEGTCPTGVMSFDAAAMGTIVYGRGSTECGDATSSYWLGMCDVFGRITPANVRIEYRQPSAPQGLGYVGRPGGPVPTIKVSLVHVPMRLLFLKDLLGNFPGISATVTAEDFSSCAPHTQVCSTTR